VLDLLVTDKGAWDEALVDHHQVERSGRRQRGEAPAAQRLDGTDDQITRADAVTLGGHDADVERRVVLSHVLVGLRDQLVAVREPQRAPTRGADPETERRLAGARRQHHDRADERVGAAGGAPRGARR